MDGILIAAIALLLLARAVVVLTRSKFSTLPGPTLRQYLPYGAAFPMYRDSSKMLSVITAMSKNYGNVFQVWLGPLDTVVTSIPADIAQILSATQCFERPKAMQAMFDSVVPRSIMCIPKQLHLAARRHLRADFNYSLLKGFHAEVNQAVDELCHVLTDLANQTPPGRPSEVFNVSEQLAITSFRVITNVAFGCHLCREERLYLAKCTDQLVDEMMLDFVGYPVRQALTRLGIRNRLFDSQKKVNAVCHKFIQARLAETKEQKACRPADLLDAIIVLEGPDLETITSQTVVFAVAGAHTTNETLAWCLYETCCNPRVTTEILKELTALFGKRPRTEPLSYEDVESIRYLKLVWKETLRKHPPGPMFIRTAQRDVLLSGSKVFIPKGSNVVALAQGSHMNPHVWREPQSFIPERWSLGNGGDRAPPGSYVPFSLGARNCAGRFLADHEGILILAELHRRFEFSLACMPGQIVACSGWVEHARTMSTDNAVGPGLPVRVELRA